MPSIVSGGFWCNAPAGILGCMAPVKHQIAFELPPTGHAFHSLPATEFHVNLPVQSRGCHTLDLMNDQERTAGACTRRTCQKIAGLVRI